MSNPRVPDFFVIGAQKAASTALLDALRGHRDAWLPAGEDHYFHDPVFGQTSEAEFLAPYAHRTELRVGLKCPDYLGSPEVPARVAQMSPGGSLISCLRNPADRAVSAYFWHVRWGLLPLEDPDRGLRRLLDGEYDHLPLSERIIDWGRYAKHLKGWLRYFDDDQLLVLFQEDLRRDRETQLTQLFNFLGLDPGKFLDHPMTESNSGVYPISRLRVLRMRNRLVVRWDDTGTHVTLPTPARFWPRLASNSVAAIDRFALSRMIGNERPPIGIEVSRLLVERFAEDVLELEQLLGRDLSAWRSLCV